MCFLEQFILTGEKQGTKRMSLRKTLKELQPTVASGEQIVLLHGYVHVHVTDAFITNSLHCLMVYYLISWRQEEAVSTVPSKHVDPCASVYQWKEV